MELPQCINEASSYRCECDPSFTGENCSDNILLDEGQTPGSTLDMQAVLGGIIGILVFLFLLIVVVLTTVMILIRKQKKKGN
jgi:hypothetical protein